MFSAYYDLGRDESAAAVDQARTNFMAGCTDSGAPEAYCGCMYDELRAAGLDTEAEMSALKPAADGGPPRAVAAAVEACS